MGKKSKKNKNKSPQQTQSEPKIQTKVEPAIVTDSIETFEEKFTVKDFDEKKAYMLELEKKLEVESKALQKESILLEEKTNQLNSKDIQLQAIFANLDSDIERTKEDKLNVQDIEISKIRLTKIEQLNSELEEERLIRNKYLNSAKEELELEKSNLLQEKIAFQKVKSDFDLKYSTFELDSRILEERLTEIDSVIKNKIEDGISDERETLTKQLNSKEEHLEELRNSLNQYSVQLERYKTVYAELGEDPIVILNKINTLEKDNNNLKNELANLPTKELEAEFEILQKKHESLEYQFNDIKSLYESKIKELENNEFYRLKFENVNQLLIHEQSKANQYEAETKNLQSRIDRLTSNNGANIDREALIRDISRPIIKFNNEDNVYVESGSQPISEIEWLKSIQENCEKYEIQFPERILYAFHTSLKISDWSQLTVLAGVSGTGKSELPRLYSAFGGINFISVAVQPTWDSSDDLLGYFNSIDNKFDAQPLLRFLVQSTTQLKNYVSIVLLDEMNLAHVENYFAEFLSKLEERRGSLNKDLPHIEVKLGAGVEPFPLGLRRNILWTGTMNQDETTKSLSDKVLDRGVVINFPRPTVFQRRSSMKPLSKTENLLKYETWAGTRDKPGWVKRELEFSDEQMKELNRLKGICEEINAYLSNVNRDLGHRIWHQIEFYIANYPKVSRLVGLYEDLTDELKEAMHTAFEDQIVQKIMPKLRGVETHDYNMECCFNKVIKLLEDEGFNLTQDIEKACNNGLCSFIWCSNEYLKEE